MAREQGVGRRGEVTRAKQISEDQRRSGEAVAKQMLVGSSLDCFRCFGTILELSFHCGGSHPYYVTLSTSDYVSVVQNVAGPRRHSAVGRPVDEDERFRAQRAEVLPQLFTLIAAEVTDASIDSTGEMSIDLDAATVVVSGSCAILETTWELTARSSDDLAEPDCYVSLTDDRELLSSFPKRPS